MDDKNKPDTPAPPEDPGAPPMPSPEGGTPPPPTPPE